MTDEVAALREEIARLNIALDKEQYRAAAGWALAQHWIDRYNGRHTDLGDAPPDMVRKVEDRIHPLTRLDGLFFVVVTSDGRLINVMMARDLTKAKERVADLYGDMAAEALSVFPAQLTWEVPL